MNATSRTFSELTKQMYKLWWRIIKNIAFAIGFSLLYYFYVKMVEQFFILIPTDVNSCSVISQSLKNFTNHYHKHPQPEVFDINRINFIHVGCVCPEKEETFLMMFINSSPKHFERRSAIRQTWATIKKKNSYINYVFMLGKHYIPEINTKVLEESEREKDVVIIDYLDLYRNLTFKSVAILRWASMFCSNSKFIMKLDDDIFVDMPPLLNLLATMTAPKIIIGLLIKQSKPFQSRTNKWFVSPKDYSAEFYPDYMCGLSYVISSDLVNDLLKAASKSHVLPIEDVYVTGICATQAGATLIGNCGFFTRPVPIEYWARNSVNIVVHNYSPKEMKDLWEVRTQLITSGLFSKWFIYLSYLLM